MTKAEKLTVLGRIQYGVRNVTAAIGPLRMVTGISLSRDMYEQLIDESDSLAVIRRIAPSSSEFSVFGLPVRVDEGMPSGTVAFTVK